MARGAETRSVPVRLEEEASAAGRKGAEVETQSYIASDHSFTVGVLPLRGTCSKTPQLISSQFSTPDRSSPICVGSNIHGENEEFQSPVVDVDT